MKVKGTQIGSIDTNSVLGTFEGECADANITNLNGLDITREVWENVFNSEEYEKGIKLGWYIGYLGHPEDPNCMDFKDACIVMTEGHINNNGKICGKFNLIDTPVGRVVKSFIDAGVTFGISVRGAGDIVGNSVDPDTFVFRGFDLVTFPAYPKSIPEFTEIAASSNVETQRKYKAICSSVTKNLPNITSCEALDFIQSKFAKQSDIYDAIESRKQELEGLNEAPDECVDITEEKLRGVMNLYIDTLETCRQQLDTIKQLESTVYTLKSQLNSTQIKCSNKIRSIERMTSDQTNHLERELRTIKADSRRRVTAAQEAIRNYKNELYELESKLEASERELKKTRTQITANKKSIANLKQQNSTSIQATEDLKSKLNKATDSNLKYKQRLETTNDELSEKDSVISDLRLELDETVKTARDLENRSSNLDATNKELKSEIRDTRSLLREYQEAYKTLYATALGVPNIKVSAGPNTSVAELQDLINNDVNSAATHDFVEENFDDENMSDVFVEPMPIDIFDNEENCDDYSHLVTV